MVNPLAPRRMGPLSRSIILAWTAVLFVLAVYPNAVHAQNADKPSSVLKVDWELPLQRALPQSLLYDSSANCLFVALKSGGLAMFDVSRPNKSPKQLALIGIEKFGGLDVMHLTQKAGLLYLALGDFFSAKGSPAGLAIVNIAQPSQPKVLGVWKSDKIMQGAATVLVDGDYAFLGAMSHGVLVFDVSNPKRITQVTEFLPDVNFPRAKPNKIQHPNARGLAIQGDKLFVAFDGGGIRVIDIKSPREPREIGRYVNAGMGQKQQAYNNLVIDGNYACVAIDYAGLEVLDIRNPRDIKQVAWWNPWEAQTLKNLWFNSLGHTNQIEYDSKRKLVYLSAGDSELLVISVSDRTHPQLVARYGDTKDKLGTWGLTLSPSHVYLTYINAVVPFQGTWSGIKAIRR